MGLCDKYLGVRPPDPGVPAVFEHAGNLGESSLLQLRCKGLPKLLHARIATPGEAGQAVSLALEPGHALWFDATGQRLDIAMPCP